MAGTEIIKYLMDLHGCKTQVELAKVLNVSKANITHFKSSACNDINRAIIIKLIEALEG